MRSHAEFFLLEECEVAFPPSLYLQFLPLCLPHHTNPPPREEEVDKAEVLGRGGERGWISGGGMPIVRW